MSRKNPVFSNDPDALGKLKAELSKLERLQGVMAFYNKIVREYRKKGDIEGGVKELVELGCPESRARGLFQPDFMGRYGFADYELKNNNANMRRIKLRIASLSVAEDGRCELMPVGGP
jgi:hypothetical protein